MISRRCFFIPGILFFFLACQSGPKPLEDILLSPVSITLNPYDKVPLGALLSFSTASECRLELLVEGDIPVNRSFPDYRKNHEIPVLGLYPDHNNIVRVKLTTQDDHIYTGAIEIKTAPLPETFPRIEITQLKRDQMEPGFHLVDMLIANNGKFLSYTIMFDDQGKVRWFMDMSGQGQITYSGYRIKNGNWLYLDWIHLIEVNDLGKIVRQEQMWGFAGNHEVMEVNNGRLLMGGSKKDAVVMHGGQAIKSRFDHAVLWDRELGRVVKAWDLRQVLDVDRMIFPPDYGQDFAADWFHVNSITQSPKDNSLLISGRNQGIVKLTNDNQLKWILAPHKNWGRAGFDGRGFETSDFLLTATDTGGRPYPQAVQLGEESTADFDWPTGQHALTVLENGHLLLFDNGLSRHYKGQPSYSRAVEYQIDEKKKTISQVWEYGKELGLNMYSPITSDVDVLPRTGNRLITAGNIRNGDLPPHARLIEITYPDNQLVFEAGLYFKDVLGNKEKDWGQFDLVFRGERYDLIAGSKYSDGAISLKE